MNKPRIVSRTILASSRTIRRNWCRLTATNNPRISTVFNYVDGRNTPTI